MKKQLRDEWVKALRSGEYKQGRRGRLREKDADGNVCHCCVGVLQELLGDPNKEIDDNRWTYLDELKITALLPSAASHFSNISDVQMRDARYKLAEMNDNGYSFTQIADWIEANIPVEP